MTKFNYTYIKEITNENIQLQIEIISVIITNLPAIVYHLNEQKNELDLKEISRLAHKLKTTIIMLRIDLLLEDVLFLEESDLEKVDIQLIVQKIERIVTDLNDVLNQLSKDLDELEQNS